MPNRQLSPEELVVANELLEEVRKPLKELSRGDTGFEWALRRKVYKELTYDERGKPMQRQLLKAKLAGKQNGRCVRCGDALPEKGAVLDRLEAMSGYTEENTRLLCPPCDIAVQEERSYT